jgi:hypothetical protein
VFNAKKISRRPSPQLEDKGSKKGYKKAKMKESSQVKKYLSKVKCIRFHKLAHYSNQYLEKKGRTSNRYRL